jgi:hypothetical protein
VKRRPFATAATAVAVALVIATRPAPARAAASSTSPNYELSFTQALSAAVPTSTSPQLVWAFPLGSITPPTSSGTTQSPLTLPSNVTGFDPSQLVVGLKDGTDNSGKAAQLFGLSFFGSGVKAGTDIPITLSVSPSLTSAPTPELLSNVGGVTLKALATSSSGSSSSSDNTSSGSSGSSTEPVKATVPEPLSLALWTALTTAGLWRARSFRRRAA